MKQRNVYCLLDIVSIKTCRSQKEVIILPFLKSFSTLLFIKMRDMICFLHTIFFCILALFDGYFDPPGPQLAMALKW